MSYIEDHVIYSGEIPSLKFGKHELSRGQLDDFADYATSSIASDFLFHRKAFEVLTREEMQQAVDNVIAGNFPFSEPTWKKLLSAYEEYQLEFIQSRAPEPVNYTRRSFVRHLAKSMATSGIAAFLYTQVRDWFPESSENFQFTMKHILTEKRFSEEAADKISEKINHVVLPALVAALAARDFSIEPLERKVMLGEFATALDGMMTARILRDFHREKDTTLSK